MSESNGEFPSQYLKETIAKVDKEKQAERLKQAYQAFLAVNGKDWSLSKFLKKLHEYHVDPRDKKLKVRKMDLFDRYKQIRAKEAVLWQDKNLQAYFQMAYGRIFVDLDEAEKFITDVVTSTLDLYRIYKRLSSPEAVELTIEHEEIRDKIQGKSLVETLALLPGFQHSDPELSDALEYRQLHGKEVNKFILEALAQVIPPREKFLDTGEDMPYTEADLAAGEGLLLDFQTALVQAEELLAEAKVTAKPLRKWRKESGQPSAETVEISPELLQKYGLEQRELKGFPEADQLIEAITKKELNPSTPEGRQRLVAEWPAYCPPPFVPTEPDWEKFYPNVPYPENITKNQGNWWFVEQLYNGKIVTNLGGGEGQPYAPRYNAETIYVENSPQEDWDATDADGKKKLQTDANTSKVLRALGYQGVGVVKVGREIIDPLLRKGDPGDRVPTEAHEKLLQELCGDDRETMEFRYPEPRETDGSKNLWTHQEGYFLGEGGRRLGLSGGYRDNGGASFVAGIWRGRAHPSLAGRLVLSRRRK